MKKLIFLVLSLVVSATATCMSKPLAIKLKKPGTLSEKVGEKRKYTTESMVLKGVLNADDVRFLREMAGSDSLFKKTPGKLAELDIREVSFLPFSGRISRKYQIQGAHTLPPVFLYGTNIERIVLPERLDSVMAFALGGCRLRKIEFPDGLYVHAQAVASDSLLQKLRLPAISGQAPTPYHYGLPALRSIKYGDLDYIASRAFTDMKDLEEIIFAGSVGHIDGYTVKNCPKLRRIIFKGPVLSTGGSEFVKDCPELEEVRFENLVFATGFGEPINCPKLKGYTTDGNVLYADTAYFRISDTKEIVSDPEMLGQARRMIELKKKEILDPSFQFLKSIEIGNYDESLALAEAIGDSSFRSATWSVVAPLKKDMDKSKLQLLRESPSYKADDKKFEWTYCQPSDSILTRDREYFNLDSIAGSGNDISRIKNLMYWLHNSIRHDGSSYNPSSRSLIDVYELCRKEKRGVNCRMLAIILTEALLAEGIPARYITCQPKLWQFDTDCHVICMVWSESLGKWIWIDPTFAAYVTDENGMMLHPGEVRQRLIDGKPLVLNEDANWNNESPQTKENYLDRYMAKNLYYMTAITANRPKPEGKGASKSHYVMLIPEGAENLPNGYNETTTDPDKFWTIPTK